MSNTTIVILICTGFVFGTFLGFVLTRDLEP